MKRAHQPDTDPTTTAGTGTTAPADGLATEPPAATVPGSSGRDEGRATDEPDMAAWIAGEGLPPDAVVLVGGPAVAAPPMRNADGACGLLVTSVDLGPDWEGVALFTGAWERGPLGPAQALAGDVVIELQPAAIAPPGPDPRVDVRLLLAQSNRWQIVGRWPGLGPEWPQVIAPTAAAVMQLYTDHEGCGPHRA